MENGIKSISKKIGLIYLSLVAILGVPLFIFMGLNIDIQIATSIYSGVVAGVIASITWFAIKKIISLDI